MRGGLVLAAALVVAPLAQGFAGKAQASPCTDAVGDFDVATQADASSSADLFERLTGRSYVQDLPISAWQLPQECHQAKLFFMTRISQLSRLLPLERQADALCEFHSYHATQYTSQPKSATATIAADKSDLAQINAVCRDNSQQNEKRGRRQCNGRVTAADFQTSDNFCVAIDNSCGFTITAKFSRSDGNTGGSFEAANGRTTVCSTSLDWKYIYLGFKDRGVD